VLIGNIRPNAVTKLSVFGLDGYIDFDVGGYGSDDEARANLVGIAQARASARHGQAFDKRTTILVGDTLWDQIARALTTSHDEAHLRLAPNHRSPTPMAL
jgi:phosphoglycolate phosphatase-like HAD superfamily hydrolase